jgi:hypothetical protein
MTYNADFNILAQLNILQQPNDKVVISRFMDLHSKQKAQQAGAELGQAHIKLG